MRIFLLLPLHRIQSQSLRTWEAINGNSLPSPMDSHRLLAGFNYHERLLT